MTYNKGNINYNIWVMNNRIIIYKSKKKSFIIIGLSLLITVAGTLFLLYTDKNVIGWSFIILSALCLIFGIGSWFDRKPYIIMTETGITEMFGAREEIEWDAIRKVDEFYYRGQFFIRLLTDRNYKPSLIQPTWFYRFDRLYEAEGFKAIFMRISFLEINSIKLSQFINRMIEADIRKRSELLNNFFFLSL